MTEPTATHVVIEALPLGSNGTCRARVNWSDGTTSHPVSWYADEITLLADELLGLTAAEMLALKHERDRRYLGG